MTRTLAVLLLLLLVAGCTPPTPPPVPPTHTVTPTSTPTATATATPSPTATATPVSVRLTLLENLPPEQAHRLAEDVTDFQAGQPGVTIDVRHSADLGRREPVGWQLVLGDAALMATLRAADRLMPLDELLAADELDDLATPGRAAAGHAGHLWGLADTLGFHLLLFYNRDLIALPPADTDEMTAVARSFTENDHWGLAVNSYDPLWVVPWLAGDDEWLTDSRGRPALDTPAMVEALTLYARWQRKPNPVAPLATHDEARRLFLDGQASMLIDGDWAIGELSQTTALNWGAAPLPLVGDTGQAAAPLVLGRFWMVHRDLPATDRTAAADFLRFVFAPGRQLAWLELFGQMPTNRRALEDPRVLTDPWLRASALQMQAGRALPLGVDANQLLDAMRAPLRAFLEGDMTPAEAARAMQLALE